MLDEEVCVKCEYYRDDHSMGSNRYAWSCMVPDKEGGDKNYNYVEPTDDIPNVCPFALDHLLVKQRWIQKTSKDKKV